MTTKRKTHLNLSGSHHTLDSDNAFVGGTVYVTGAINLKEGANETTLNSGSLTYSGGPLGDKLLIQAQTANLDLEATGVGKKIRLKSDTEVTGSLIVTVGLTGSLSETVAGNPFIVAGSNITANYNSLGQWEITGSGGGGSPGGANTQIQFNENGTTFQGDAQLTFNTASVGSLTPYTLAAPTASFKVLSGSNDTTFLTSFGIAEALLVNSNVAVTQSMIFFDGKDQAIDAGGTMYLNGASIEMYSGSAVGDSDFTIAPNVDGSGGVYVKFDNLINIRPLYVTMSTGDATPTLLSGSLLTGSLRDATISKLDFNVIAIEQASDNFASWTFSATIRSNLIDQRTVLAATELDSIFEGANASTWDVNINTNGDIYCTGSAGTVHWYAQATKKMVLSGSGDLLY